MTDKELYKVTFSHLRASGSEITEVKQMSKGHIRKSLFIGVAAAAIMATAAGAANVATDGEFFEGIKLTIVGNFDVKDYIVNEDGSREFKAVDEDGNEYQVGVYPDKQEDDVEYTITLDDNDKNSGNENDDSVELNSFVTYDENGSVVVARSEPVENRE